MDLRELRRIKLPENLQAAVLSLERGKTFDATGANRVENGTMTRTVSIFLTKRREPGGSTTKRANAKSDVAPE